MRCSTHPDVETGLTCNKCGKSICPGCMVQTPVGARCPQCARLNRLPTFQLSGIDYLKAILVGIAAAAVCGILWFFIRTMLPFMGFFNLLLAATAGYGTGQAVSAVVNRKRGVYLKVIAGICVLIAFIIGNQVTSWNFILTVNVWAILALGIGIYMATIRL